MASVFDAIQLLCCLLLARVEYFHASFLYVVISQEVSKAK